MSVEVCATVSLGIVPYLKIALEEILAGARRRNVLQQEPGWKLLLFVAKDDVAQTATWRFDGQGQVGGQVRRIRSWNGTI